MGAAATGTGAAAGSGRGGPEPGMQLGGKCAGSMAGAALLPCAAVWALGSASMGTGIAAWAGASAGAPGSGGRLPLGTVQMRGSPFLYRTPHALHSVRGPSGPQRHCGVWCAPQLRHVIRRDRRVVPAARAQSSQSQPGSALDRCHDMQNKAVCITP